MLTKATDDLIKDFSKIAATLLVAFGLLCLRTWLVSVCAALLVPASRLVFGNGF
jgi:hypothetical protein